MGGDYELCLFFPSDKVQIFFELLDLAVNHKARATACESSYGGANVKENSATAYESSYGGENIKESSEYFAEHHMGFKASGEIVAINVD